MSGHHHHHHHHHHHGQEAAQGQAADHHDHAGASLRRLRLSLAILFAFTVIEAAGGWWANSIALLAEAGHMLADSASLLLAIVAVSVSRRPPNATHTFGHRRYQTLAAFTNGLLLVLLTFWVMFEAVRRLTLLPPVDGGLMLAVALIGGLANFAAFLALSGARSLNERGARAHIVSDLLGSAAAAGAALLILAFGWRLADPLLSLFVSFLILRSGWHLMRDAAHVLLEGTPSGLDLEAVEHDLESMSGVTGVHHLHAWSLTGEAPMVTLHARLAPGVDRHGLLAAIHQRLRERHGVEHATVQIEEGECVDLDTGDCRGACGNHAQKTVTAHPHA